MLFLTGMNEDKTNNTKNQGEGDRASARRYERDVKGYVARGKEKVERAASSAKTYVEQHGDDARRAERQAARGPHAWPTFDELVARGKQWIERMRAKYAKK
jgi:hypothetical protein